MNTNLFKNRVHVHVIDTAKEALEQAMVIREERALKKYEKKLKELGQDIIDAMVHGYRELTINELLPTDMIGYLEDLNYYVDMIYREGRMQDTRVRWCK